MQQGSTFMLPNCKIEGVFLIIYFLLKMYSKFVRQIYKRSQKALAGE